MSRSGSEPPNTDHSSRLPALCKSDPAQRLNRIEAAMGPLPERAREIYQGDEGLSLTLANQMVENVIGTFTLPLGVAANLRISGIDRLVPMAIEEPSVVAAISNMARLARGGAGIVTHSAPPEMIAQIQILDLPDLEGAALAVQEAEAALLAEASSLVPRLLERGGGPRSLNVRPVHPPPEEGGEAMLIVHINVDCQDAMGANLVNAIAEGLAPTIAELTGGRIGLRILSNLADRRLATAKVCIPIDALAQEGIPGGEVAQGVVEAYRFAAADPYRAATHNKGVMNGIDAVAIATGNDWRAIEAGAHAYAARSGQYSPMTRWYIDGEKLRGICTLPMPVGVVGGTIPHHPTVQTNLKLMGSPRATELGEIMVAVGLIQNLAALVALSTEGIQRGHMSLHARGIASRAGVPIDAVSEVARAMTAARAFTLQDAQRIYQTRPRQGEDR